MTSRFDSSLKAQLTLDGDKVRGIDHLHHAWQGEARTPRGAAESYLRAMASTLQLPAESLQSLHQAAEYTNPRHQGIEYRLSEEKSFFDATTFGYWQTCHNVPVWDAGLTVTVKHNPSRVAAAVDHSHVEVKAELPSEDKIRRYQRFFQWTGLNDPKIADLVDASGNEANAHLASVLGLKGTDPKRRRAARQEREGRLIWRKGRFFLYRYDPTRRLDPAAVTTQAPKAEGSLKAEKHAVPTLPLPRVPAGIEEGRYYLVVEAIFSHPTPAGDPMNWRALIDVETDAVLYLRALTDHVDGLVFNYDPISATGNAANGPASSNATLNPLRNDVTLSNLNAPVAGVQSLAGSRGVVVNRENPNVAAPTRPSGSDFDYPARTNDFAAVNAYYHHDRMFTLLEDLGFPLGTYLNGTSFPIDVDHRGLGNAVNAHCIGDGDGIDHVCYALADAADTANPIGIAADWRVHLHEVYGHGILYDHVGSANFGFAHSAGDSFAAILCDPFSTAPDRFVTFPWVNIGRRHDRTPAAGWGWAGTIALNPFHFTHDYAGYNNEQILSTTLFRIYRSLGGDSPHQTRRVFASHMTSYLVLRAISTFTPGTNPANALALCNALMTVDLLNWTSEGLFGGAYNKVIRWAFEKQGLFQAPGTATPNNNAGVPPEVDLYIEDGRNGEYGFQAVHWNNGSIWNRLMPDGMTGHQPPVLSQINYAYVKIKNRGTQTATGITVRGFHTLPGAGLTWPADFEEFSPVGGLPVASLAGNSASEVIVGPFQWTPTINAYGHDCMLMIVSNLQDPSNIDHFTPGEQIAEWRLVPNDNNIGQRNVNPVPGGGGLAGLIAGLERRFFVVGNPGRLAGQVEVRVQLPPFLAQRGWAVSFHGLEGYRFRLQPGAKRTLRMHVHAGQDFSADDVRAAAGRDLVMEIYLDDILIGGMTYPVDPDLTEPVNGGDDGHAGRCRREAQDLLRCLKLDAGKVKCVRVKKVSLDIVLGGCCED